MGKKRRLNSANLKFNAKHSAHPRMKLLVQTTQQAPEVEIAEETATLAKPPEVETVSASLTPKKAETATKAKKSATTRKKSTTSTRKRTAKKKANNASA